MSLASREYIARQGRGDRPSVVRLHRELAEILQDLRVTGRIEGFGVRELYDSEDILDQDLEESDVLAATEGALPVVWLNVTYHVEQFGPADLTDLEKRYGLELIGIANPR